MLRLTVKIFQFLCLTAKFLALLRLTVNPIETLAKLYKFKVHVHALTFARGGLLYETDGDARRKF